VWWVRGTGRAPGSGSGSRTPWGPAWCPCQPAHGHADPSKTLNLRDPQIAAHYTQKRPACTVGHCHKKRVRRAHTTPDQGSRRSVRQRQSGQAGWRGTLLAGAGREAATEAAARAAAAAAACETADSHSSGASPEPRAVRAFEPARTTRRFAHTLSAQHDVPTQMNPTRSHCPPPNKHLVRRTHERKVGNTKCARPAPPTAKHLLALPTCSTALRPIGSEDRR
jgi:hypothetical protein